MPEDIWEGLANKYLEENDIWDYQHDKKAKRKLFINKIKQRLFEDIWIRMKNCGETSLPLIDSIQSEFIKKDRKCDVKIENSIKSATIENIGTHFIIKINRSQYNSTNSYRWRSYLAHELGHTFLYNLDKTPIRPYYEYEGKGLYYASKSIAEIYKKEEGFIFEIALHILVPDEYLRKIVSPIPSIEEFIKACEEFKITREMMVRRLYWYTYNWSTRDNYWSDSAFYFYPYFAENSFIRHPRGNNEVFRGVLFKKERSFEIKEYWYKMINLIIDALDKPEKIISKQLELGKKKIKGEAIYLSNENRFLIMVKPFIEDV